MKYGLTNESGAAIQSDYERASFLLEMMKPYRADAPIVTPRS